MEIFLNFFDTEVLFFTHYIGGVILTNIFEQRIFGCVHQIVKSTILTYETASRKLNRVQ